MAKIRRSKKGNRVILTGGKKGSQPVAGAMVEYRTPKAKAKKKFLVTIKKKFTNPSTAMSYLRSQTGSKKRKNRY